MKKIKIKHIIFFFLGALTLSTFIHFGDYCEGMADGFLWMFFLLLFLISFIVIAIINLVNIKRKKEKFDYVIYIFFIIICFVNYYKLTENEISKQEDNYITALQFQDGSKHDHELTLKNDNTFSLKIDFTDFREFTVGNYKINNGILVLLRDDISKNTDNNFTNKYKLNIKDSLLIPMIKGFDTLKIKTVQIKK